MTNLLSIALAFAFICANVKSDPQQSIMSNRRLQTRYLRKMASDHFLVNGYTPFYFQSNENKCLDSSRDTLSVSPCSYSKSQYFALIDGRRRTIHSLDKSKCLTATADGSISFKVCDGRMEEQWFFRDHDKTMVSEKFDTKCLTLKSNGDVKLEICSSAAAQTLVISAVPKYVYIVFPHLRTCQEKNPHYTLGGGGNVHFYCSSGWESVEATFFSTTRVTKCRKCTASYNYYPIPNGKKLKAVANQKHVFVKTANNLLIHKDTGKCMTKVGDNAELRACESLASQKFQYKSKELFLISNSKKIQLSNDWLKLTEQSSDIRVIPIEHHLD